MPGLQHPPAERDRRSLFPPAHSCCRRYVANSSAWSQPARNIIDTFIQLHDFSARSPDELSLRKGEQVVVLEQDGTWRVLAVGFRATRHAAEKSSLTLSGCI